MSNFVLCVGCGEPLYGCTCEQCGNDLRDEFCSLCNLRNSCAYDPNLNSFDSPPDSCHPPHPTYETYSCESCGNDSHFGYDCPPRDEDDDEEFSIPMSEIHKSSLTAITPGLPITDSLIMEDEHLSTISETESDELIKSSVENLVLNPSESEDLSDIESECDVPVGDDFMTFFNLLFDADDNFSSNDDESFSDEDEFSGELAHINLILPGINEVDFDPKEEIRLVEKLLYDNSSPRPPEEFNFENSDVIIESFSPSHILVEDSDSLMEEIDLSLTPNDSMPPGIENDDSEGDILFLEELLSNDSPSLPENESFHFDVPSSPRPPAKPPDVRIYFDLNTRLLTAKVVDISEHYVLMPRLLPTQPTLASNEEKSPHLLSHLGFKSFQLSSESPMMIYGGDSPILDVPFLHFYPP
uniref:Pre-mRNA splicing Prp18-interacting factor n=1 Tax=Tanacetum cinerariifolium TaxID=118510 RepID=A0A6L2LRU6_TANCI|nr:hypothetical protein [Tanacetum cinerariifolium]